MASNTPPIAVMRAAIPVNNATRPRPVGLIHSSLSCGKLSARGGVVAAVPHPLSRLSPDFRTLRWILAALIALIEALVQLWKARMGLHDGALGQVFWDITHVGSSAVSSFSSASLASCSSSNQSG